jgi:nicotinamidase-related amidase
MLFRLFTLSLACVAYCQTVRLPLRTRVEPFKGSRAWEEARAAREIIPRRTVIIICDMWDRHWCTGANQRVASMLPRMVKTLEAARAAGMLIVHAPSDTMPFYKDYPQRQRMLEIPPVEPPANRDIPDPPLPIDDQTSSCDTLDIPKRPLPWTRQHAAIPIAGNDFISANGREIYSLIKPLGIQTVLLMGVHTNMCILNRTFAIKQMTRWGMPVVLVRDLTDTMYDPRQRPFVSHDVGTDLVIEHIEKYWCPTTSSGEILSALGAAGGRSIP